MPQEQDGDQAGGLTMLIADSDHRASKHYRWNGGTFVKVSDYDLGFFFRPQPYQLVNLDDLAGLVTAMQDHHNAVIVRGALDEEYYAKAAIDPSYRITRRKNASPKDNYLPHLIECQRRWAMIDLDGVPLPPDADIANNPVAAIKDVIADAVPPCFHDVRCFYQWSNSAGMVQGIAKLHLFYWLVEAIDNLELRRWFRHYAPCVDTAPFSGNQPHFICPPMIEGADDPLPSRVGWIDGAIEAIALPPVPVIAKGRKIPKPESGRAITAGLHAESIEDALAALGDGQDANGASLNGFHAPLLAAAMQYALWAAKGGLRDDEAMMARLSAAIEAAPKRDGRDVAGYLDAAYLTRIIDGGFGLIANSQPPGVAQVQVIGFGMTKAGLWFTDPNAEDAKPVWVCKPFEVQGMCADEASGNWGTILRWQDQRDAPHIWVVGRDMLHGEPAEIAKVLEREGLEVNYNAQKVLRRCLAALHPERHLTIVSAAGWHEDNFILRDGTVIGDSDVMLRPDLVMADASCGCAGTLLEWQREVAGYAVGNSRVALFTSAAFAGALLDIASEPSGGFHQHGVSQSGKSTGAYAAGSVHGKGARRGKGNVHQWAATSNGLEAVAARYCDGCLILDEIAQADAKDAGDAIYRLANETGKVRANQTGGYRPRADWRILFLSTGEITLQQRMSAAGKQTMTGMEVRLVNIPADAGAGLGVFENLHGFANGAELADHIRHAAQTFYGVAGRQFIEKLAAWRHEDPDGLADWIRQMRASFVTKLPAMADGQVRSVAARFGIVAAAGELAVSFGILPWPVGEAVRAAERCFGDWLAARGTIGSGEKQTAIRQVRAVLEAHGTSRFIEIRSSFGDGSEGVLYRNAMARDATKPADEQDAGQLGVQDRAFNQMGFRKLERDKGGKDVRTWYWVTPEMWASEVCKGLDPKLAAQAIKERGWLDHEAERLTKNVRVPQQIKTRRMYVINGDILAADDD